MLCFVIFCCYCQLNHTWHITPHDLFTIHDNPQKTHTVDPDSSDTCTDQTEEADQTVDSQEDICLIHLTQL